MGNAFKELGLNRDELVIQTSKLHSLKLQRFPINIHRADRRLSLLPYCRGLFRYWTVSFPLHTCRSRDHPDTISLPFEQKGSQSVRSQPQAYHRGRQSLYEASPS